MRPTKPLTLSCLLLVTLSACGLYSGSDQTAQTPASIKNKQRLGDVYFEPLALDHTPLAQPKTQTMRDAYKALLDEVDDDSQTKKIVQYRLADLEVTLAEQKLEDGEPVTAVSPSTNQSAPKQANSSASSKQKLFDLAISQYQQLLAQHPQNPDNLEVLYQLAKAYEQQGQIQQSFDTLQRLLKQFPDNPYLAESYFRLGEIEFNRTNYLSAIEFYAQVLQLNDSPYFGTAAYMLGWSYFKSDKQKAALDAFTTLLDYKLPNEVVAESALIDVDSQGQIDGLPVGEKRLVNDTIRIMSLLFSYQDGQYSRAGLSVEQHFDLAGNKHYEYLLYDALAQHYLNQDRYRDSAHTYQAFTEVHGKHVQAPVFAVKQIDAYILGKFPTLVLPAKQRFVMRYGIKGDYWPQWPIVLQEQVAPYLNQYLQELAQFEHSRGQMLSKASIEAPIDKSQRNSSSPKELAEQANQALLLAAKWYQQFILTFPEDGQTPELTYRLGEALFDAQQYEQAIDAFESYAYQHIDAVEDHIAAHPKAAEAAYSIILAYREMLKGVLPPAKDHMLDQQLIAQEHFVEVFAQDNRASEVLYNSMQQLFAIKRYPEAILSAQKLASWQPEVDHDKKLASYLVQGHSQFALEQFAQAESTYEQIMLYLPQNDPRHPDMRERLAASIYKQGEQKVASNYLPLAINDFLRVIAKTPGSAIRLNAQYDAATYLLQMKEWQQGIELLEDFRLRFPNHKLTANIQDKLIEAYQQNEDWQQAADELLVVHKSNPQSEQGRQALYVAAQYLYKIDNRQGALNAYRTYAHSYPTPFVEANEARFIMSEFYVQSNEPSKRRFWLNKLIQADKQAQRSNEIQRTNRSRYLAAMASNVFADDKLYVYKRIKLTQPLKVSLAKKKAALNTALDAYNQTLAYQIEEFTTSANFSIADIYHQLAKDLMASSKPKNLNALELEQYDLLLEEQAYPFEEQAIDIHQTNAQRSWQGTYDAWVQKSFGALESLLPGRYNKHEKSSEGGDEIF